MQICTIVLIIGGGPLNINLNNIKNLNECRNAVEIKELLKRSGINIPIEKINELKETLKYNEENKIGLSNKQLSNIAGGIFKLGKHFYSRAQAKTALEYVGKSASSSTLAPASESQPLLSQANSQSGLTDIKVSELIQLYNVSLDKEGFRNSLQQIIDSHESNKIRHYDIDTLAETGETSIGCCGIFKLWYQTRDVAKSACDDMDKAQLDRIKSYGKAGIITVASVVGLALIITNAVKYA